MNFGQISSNEVDFQNILSNERERCNQYKHCYQTLKEKHTRVEAELSSIYQQLKETREQSESLKSAYESQIDQLEKQVKDQQVEINDLLKKIRSFDAKKIETNAKDEITKHYESTIHELHNDIDKLRDQCSNLHFENTAFKCKLDSHDAQHTRTVERINLQHLAELEQFQTKIEDLQQEKQPASDMYIIDLKSSKREVLQLSSKLKALTAECEELRAQNENVSLQLIAANRLNQKQSSEHITNLRSLESEKSKLSMQNGVLQKELENAQEHRQTLNTQLNSKQREILSLKAKLEDAQHNCKKISSDFQVEIDRYKIDLEAEKEQLSEEISRLDAELKTEQESHTRERQSMLSENQDLQQNLTCLKQQMWKQTHELQEKRDKMDHQMVRIETERDQLVSQLNHEIQVLKQKLQECASAKSELEKELIARNQNNTKYTESHTASESAKYERHIQVLSEKLDSLLNIQDPRSFPTKIQSENNETEILQLKLEFEQQKLQYRQRIDELENQLREYKNSLSIENRELDNRLKHSLMQITKLKDKLNLQKTKYEKLLTLKEDLQKNVPAEEHHRLQNRLVNLQQKWEKYHSLIALDPTHLAKNAPGMTMPDFRNIFSKASRDQNTFTKRDTPAKNSESHTKSLNMKEKLSELNSISSILTSSSDLEN